GPAETRACRNREMMRGLRIEPERERANKSRIGRHVPDHKHEDVSKAMGVEARRPPVRAWSRFFRHCEERSDEAIQSPSFRDGASAPDPESRDSGFASSTRLGMTANEASFILKSRRACYIRSFII